MNRKKLCCLLLAGLVLLSLVACAASVTAPEKGGASILSLSDHGVRFEKGRKTESGAIRIVNLYGDWREMGRQYGSLLSEELTEVYAFTKLIAEANDMNSEKVAGIIRTQWEQSPYTIRQFMAGASETSGLTEEQLQAANAVERIAGLPMCSAAVAWDSYAKDELVIGRNYDYGEDFKALRNAVVIAVFHPADGSLATATIGYAGEIYAVNALNEKGIFLELNNGKPSANIKSPSPRITGTTALFDMLFEADSLDYVERFFNTTACSSSYIINVADGAEARSYEWCPVGVKRGDSVSQDGLLVSTNHYLHPDWTFATPTDDTSWTSLTRRDNLIGLCGQSKGDIDADRMMGIMDKFIDEGGAKNEATVYQLVVIPESLTLWLKIEDAAEWTQIDMASFLKAGKPAWTLFQ